MPKQIADPVRHPAHYEIYPVQPIEITRHLGFCLGNAVKYVLRAPWKGGVEDCDKALQYLAWEWETPQGYLLTVEYNVVDAAVEELVAFLTQTKGDNLWRDIGSAQSRFLANFALYLANVTTGAGEGPRCGMVAAAHDLSRILSLRDTTGQIYEGMTGRPQTQEAE